MRILCLIGLIFDVFGYRRFPRSFPPRENKFSFFQFGQYFKIILKIIAQFILISVFTFSLWHAKVKTFSRIICSVFRYVIQNPHGI